MNYLKMSQTRGLLRGKKNQLSSFLSLSSLSRIEETAERPDHTLCNTVEHGITDCTKMFSFPQLAAQGSLMKILPKQFKTTSETLNNYGMVLRQPSIRIIEQLERQNSNFLLYGQNGSGKSMSLLHVAHYCALKQWILVVVPSAVRFVDSQSRTQVVQSPWRPARMDQPTEAATWLKIFSQMNSSALLQKLKTSQSYKWGKREITEQGKPLTDVINHGVGRESHASDVIGVLLKELKSQKQLKILFAINGFNSLFHKTSHKFNNMPVDIANLSLVHHFTKCLEPDEGFNSGCNMFVLSQRSQFSTKIPNQNDAQSYISDQTYDLLKDYEKIHVDRYSDEEFNTIMHYYKDKGWLTRDLDAKLLSELKFASQMNPGLVSLYCSEL